jgi:hypothetical protein
MDKHCETCAACEVKTVPYILYEAAVERESRRAKRNLAAFIVALLLCSRPTRHGWLR